MGITRVAVAVVALLLGGQGVVANEQPHRRSFFYTGGGYVDDGSGEHIFRDQMYVEHLSPVNGASQDTPIVLIHGQAQTGTVSSTSCLNPGRVSD